MSTSTIFTADKIRELCYKKKEAISTGNGFFNFDTRQINNLSLISNGIEFRDLSHDSLLAALAGSLNASLYPSQILIVSKDYYFAWAWCAQLLLTSNVSYLAFEDYDLKDLLKNTVISALVRNSHSRDLKIGHYERLLISQSTNIFPYLTFPLLEAVLRRANRNYIDTNGVIVSDFTVQSRGGGLTKYGTVGKKTCSSVRDLLWLYYNNASVSGMAAIDECLQCVSSQSHKHPFDQIYDWRNGLMHGNESLNLAGGAILTLCFSILLIETEQEFESMRQNTCQFLDIYKKRQEREDYIYYPPYE